MSKVVGMGCRLSSSIGAFCGANENRILEETATAVSFMGLAGEIAYERLKKMDDDAGLGTYHTFLINAISNMNWELLKIGMKIELK
ncbi:unnamed protein product [Rotaria sp. Silwood1]|nr:unnamed protein product [Rotaria sp. Silwood1]